MTDLLSTAGDRTLYSHTVTLNRAASQGEVMITLINGVSEAYTSLDQVASYMYTKGYTELNKSIPAIGTQKYESDSKYYLDIAISAYAPDSTKVKLMFRHMLESGTISSDSGDGYTFTRDNVVTL